MAKPILALVSPNQNAYSETFIHAHRRLIDADIRYYYGGLIPRCLDGSGPLQSKARAGLIQLRMRRSLLYPELNIDQICFLDSLRRERVQVVLAEYGMTGAAVLPVCRQIGLPLIVHFHGLDASVDSVLERHHDSYRAMFEYAICIVAVSRFMEQRLLQMGCPRDKLVYNVYGPDDAFFDIEPTDPLPRRFIGVGRFVDKKAPYYTLLAFRQVWEKFQDAELVIAGTGPLWSVCDNLVRYFGMERNVTLTGVLGPDQVRQQFAHCTAFVQHSITGPDGNMEGTPVAVIEAAAAGLPVIATRHAGIPDIVIDGETGFMVDEHDVDGMACRMCRVLEQPERARTMGAAGRRRIRERFTLARHISMLNEYVDKALNRSE
jgi:glycosyltransferase involved in cell wall biosynthesis